MKDSGHHIKHVQKKVVHDCRMDEALAEREQAKRPAEGAIGPSSAAESDEAAMPEENGPRYYHPRPMRRS